MTTGSSGDEGTSTESARTTAEGPAGFDAVIVANRGRLIRFLESLGAGEMAEDLLHELWANLRDRPAGPVSRPLSYVYRAAHNLMRDRYRSVRQTRVRDHDWSRLTDMEQIDASTPSVERAIMARQSLDVVMEALASVGPRAEACLRLHRIDGRSQKEVAIQLGVSLSTVEGDLRRAYAALLQAKKRIDAI